MKGIVTNLDFERLQDEAFEDWVRGLPRARGVMKFADPVRREGIEYRVVRANITIFYEPVSFADPWAVRAHPSLDGGTISNFPAWPFDADERQRPTVGMKLTREQETPIGEELAEPVPRGGVRQVIGYLRSLVDTMMAAHDRLYVDQHDFDQRTIGIDTLGVGTTEFDLSAERPWSSSSRAAPPRRSS